MTFYLRFVTIGYGCFDIPIKSRCGGIGRRKGLKNCLGVCCVKIQLNKCKKYAGVVELADARDLKSLEREFVSVRARSPAPNFRR